MALRTYIEAIRDGMAEELRRDPRVFVIGEDVGTYGGAFRATQGFLDEFGEQRILDTPIAESGIVGMAVGAALNGMRPTSWPLITMDMYVFVPGWGAGCGAGAGRSGWGCSSGCSSSCSSSSCGSPVLMTRLKIGLTTRWLVFTRNPRPDTASPYSIPSCPAATQTQSGPAASGATLCSPLMVKCAPSLSGGALVRPEKALG